jgi:predicted MFS family arabinose efflux permease
MCVGFGLIVSPVIGSILYDLGGYMTPFIALSGVQLLICVSLRAIVPSKIDLSSNELRQSENQQNEEI